MNRIDRFLELIEEPAPPPTPDQNAELVQPLRDLAEALNARGVKADVRTSEDGRRYHLLLWPPHRPAYRSSLITMQVSRGRAIVANDQTTQWFTTAEEVTRWLETFVQTPAFRVSLENLRGMAREPVDARLERANGMATLVGVPPTLQEELDRLPVGSERELHLELNDGEPIPDAAALHRLDSAGVPFLIRSASMTDRTVHLRVVKQG